jgi:5-methylcytosine-specific restriction endonuclease McrA
MQAVSPDGEYPTWRWDQGRIEYLRVDHVARLSEALCNVSGLHVSEDDLEIRKQLYSATDMPFKPMRYTLWRNYGRVFKVLLLAQTVDHRIQATSLARAVYAAGSKQLDSDRYLELVFALTRFPHPAFQKYLPIARPARPFVAILRYLLNNKSRRGVSAEDVCTHLLANRCIGDEPDSFYVSLPSGSPSSAETTRQVREMLKFASQHSALAWLNSRLVSANRASLAALLERLSKLRAPEMQGNTEDEIRGLAQIASGMGAPAPWAPGDSQGDTQEHPLGISFLEGDRRLVQHSRLERNRRLRKYVIRKAVAAAGNEDLACNCCGLVPRHKYPWSDSLLLEVHHLLPLSSPARTNSAGTNISNVVLVCPTCHRAVHTRYRLYLAERKVGDFASESEAVALYTQVREEILGSPPKDAT